MLSKVNTSLLRRRIPLTFSLVTFTLFLVLLLLPSVDAQRTKPLGPKPISGTAVEVTPAPRCCGKKPPFKEIPGYMTSTYASFTGQIAIATNYSGGGTKPSLVIWDLKNQNTAPLGVQWTVSSTNTNFYSHPDWIQSKIGDVDGIALDGSGNIYLSATRVYGFNNVGSSAITPGSGGNGDIYKVNGNTGNVTRLIETASVNTYVSGDKLPNKGVGLGKITYSCDYDKLYVSDFEDGKIYRINPSSRTILSKWDHGQKLPLASPSRPAVLDSATDGLTQASRRVYAVKVLGNRFFYSIWSVDQGTPGSPNEIWSVGLDAFGDFVGGAKLEATLPPLTLGGTFSNPVADISFNAVGDKMLLAERSMNPNLTTWAAHNSRLLEYQLVAGVWTLPSTTKFKIGFYTNQTNAAGGNDYDNAPNGLVWATGDYLNPSAVYGLQGSPVGGGNYLSSVLIDLNNSPGTGDKRWMGDVEIPCYQCDVVPPAPIIAGPEGGCAKPGQYCVKQAQGVTYSWNVTGGTPATATGGCVNIAWGSTSPKVITVTATNAAGCTSTTTLALKDCTQTPTDCCDKIAAVPYPQNNVQIDYRTFTITNLKAPVSPICSVDISMAPVPNPIWQGGDLYLDGVYQPPATRFVSPYIRIPNKPANSFISATNTVKFNLGVDYTIGWIGTVTFVVNHCDGSKCILTYGPWTALPPSPVVGPQVFDLNVSPEGKLLTLSMQMKQRDWKGTPKWISFRMGDEKGQIFAASATPTRESRGRTSGEAMVATSGLSPNSVLYTFAPPFKPGQLAGSFNLILRRDPSAANAPLIWTTYDSDGNALETGTITVAPR